MIDQPFETVLREVLDARVAEIHTALPAQIVAYYADHQTADVQPMVKDAYYDTDGNLKVRSFPVLPSVPVAFLRGGGYFVALPLEKGDTGMLIFSELPLDRWRSSGQEAHPVNARRHGAGNAVFYPGVRPRAQKLDEDGVDTHLVLGKEGGAQVHVKDDEVHLYEENASDFVALAQKVATELTRIQTDLTTLKTAIATGLTAVGAGLAANGATGASAFNGAASAVPSSPSSTAAEKVRAT